MRQPSRQKMKKNILFILAVCFAILFSACHKEGRYNPKKKISKIYTTFYDDENRLDYGVRQLSEVWTWNKNNTLDKIEWFVFYYHGGNDAFRTTSFTYDKKRRIKTITQVETECSPAYSEYFYKGKYLSEIKISAPGDGYNALYKITHKNGKISEVAVTEEYDESYKGQGHPNVFPLQFVLSEEVSKDIEKSIEKQCLENKSKNIYTYTFTYTLTWENDNVTKVESSIYDNGEIFKYQYDNHLNPYCDFLDLDLWGYGCAEGLSKNNIIRSENIGHDDAVTTYDYTYDGDYPISYTYSKISSLGWNLRYGKVEYEYLK